MWKHISHFLIMWKPLDNVERDKMFKVLQSNSILNLLLYYSSSSISSISNTNSSSSLV
jgi:hypothetical protein